MSALTMSEPAYFASQHDLWMVVASVVIATLASYVTLDMSRRVRTVTGEVNVAWLLAGSVVMGTGIWSMHFVGMLGFSLPIRIGFSGLLTLLSWTAAVAASGVALRFAGQADYRASSILAGSLAMGAGICSMHYVGMAAIDLAPGIVWNKWLVIASALIAVATSAVALLLFRLLMQVRIERRLATQILAAVVMGVAICGMHYTGMAAANFPYGSVCNSVTVLTGIGLSTIVIAASCLLLLGALLASILEARLQAVARQLAQSLRQSNARLQRANTELSERTFCDPLTGLPNRSRFEERVVTAAKRLGSPGGLKASSRGRQEVIAVIFIGIDGFKPVNDSFGHAAGDVILKSVARRLVHLSHAGDSVARVGGDEFLLLLEGLAGPQDCVQVAERVLAAIADPFDAGGRRLQLACSIGAATFSGLGDAGKIIANAGVAMYEAKRAGGACHVMFDPRMAVDTAEQSELQGELREALEQDQFELYYQPKIEGRRNKMCGVEALVRWNHPRLGLVGPDHFISLAERSGLIVRLGTWVINEACRQIASWNAEGLHLRIAFNLSAVQLRDPALLDKIEEALRRHDVLGSRLLCEVTESVAMQEKQVTQQFFEGLERLGIQLSIDDFGTGHSSLSQLRNVPAQQLKIDRSFVEDLETQKDARSVVDAVIKLAHALRLTVVAEGVETVGQRDILLRMGCDEFQGFLYARPMRALHLATWSIAESLLPPAPTAHAQLSACDL